MDADAATAVPLSGAREMDGVTLRKKPLLGFIKACAVAP